MSFADKVILITGASSGIGADAARHLARLGAKVSMVGRNKARLNAVAEEIQNAGSPTPYKIIADVTKDAERIVNETVKHFGKLDVLINSAGIGKEDSVINADLAEFDRLFDTNVRAIINLTKFCVPHLQKTSGNVVSVSSVLGSQKVVANWMSYCMSKGALDQFTKCSSLDLAEKKIRINSINPAAVRTPFGETSGMTTKQYEQIMDYCREFYPVHRVGSVTDTSEAIAFLANDKSASFITGLCLQLDGGSVAAGK